ncbi:uncharacterized protein LOC121244844 [Juglans microcarpa x Juglans regia]|uniref:uncharacterized protein LOC121244844 n=1 Tax=Juglans microcarpa x Juglans regia TaxID=2249226 RepID=UPI001B7EB580|nr:uncharacterized protein LOC121244844 [Juglans microcarpa x Juglans regia]
MEKTEKEAEAAEIVPEIEEAGSDPDGSPQPTDQSRSTRTVKTKVPEVEIRLFRQGKGPIDVFKSSLGGWDQDQLEVRDILDKYGFKSIFAFNPRSGRGLAIRFNSRNGRSVLTYRDGSVIYVDGEPKDSLMKPVTKILVGVAVITILITLVLKETPVWVEKFNIFGGSFPPWILACVVIVFTRTRKRTKDFLKKFGW